MGCIVTQTHNHRGGSIVTQEDSDGWREWKKTFRQALFGVMDQGEIATTATESTTPDTTATESTTPDKDDDIDDFDHGVLWLRG